LPPDQPLEPTAVGVYGAAVTVHAASRRWLSVYLGQKENKMIRAATESDARAIADIYNYYIANSVVTFEELTVSQNDIFERIQKVTGSDLPWLVAEDEGAVIGYAYAGKWNVRSAYRHTVETTVYLSNSSVSKGWGTKLYTALFDNLRHNLIHVVIGGITLPNPASIALHEKFGMKKVAHFKAVGYKFGQWLDVGYWQTELKT
jgi:L-amino acid N-acyltransferase YncA